MISFLPFFVSSIAFSIINKKEIILHTITEMDRAYPAFAMPFPDEFLELPQSEIHSICNFTSIFFVYKLSNPSESLIESVDRPATQDEAIQIIIEASKITSENSVNAKQRNEKLLATYRAFDFFRFERKTRSDQRDIDPTKVANVRQQHKQFPGIDKCTKLLNTAVSLFTLSNKCDRFIIGNLQNSYRIFSHSLNINFDIMNFIMKAMKSCVIVCTTVAIEGMWKNQHISFMIC